MTYLTLIELERAQGEAASHVLTHSTGTLAVKESLLLLDHLIKMGQRAEAISRLPQELLVEAGGMDSRDMEQLCRSVLQVVRIHLDLLQRVGLLAEQTAAAHGAASPDLSALHECQRSLLQAQASNEQLLAKATAPKRPIDWEQVRRNEEALGRGEGIRLNPKAKG